MYTQAFVCGCGLRYDMVHYLFTHICAKMYRNKWIVLYSHLLNTKHIYLKNEALNVGEWNVFVYTYIYVFI